MTGPIEPYPRTQRTFLLVLTLAISLVFIVMIRRLLLAVVMAAIFTALTRGLYQRLLATPLRRVRWAQPLASTLTLLAVLLLILVPVLGLLGVVVDQALNVSESVGPWLEQQRGQLDRLEQLMSRLPFAPAANTAEWIREKIGELAGNIGGFVVRGLTTATRGALTFVFNLFVMLFAMFFFYIDGLHLRAYLLSYIPLPPADKERMIGKFVSVARATIKGTLVIGVVQGTLGGLAFWVAGIGQSVFWGTLMMVGSFIPGVGPALIWVPAVIYLAAAGEPMRAVLLGAWCIAVVGTVDNFLRPRLVGRDTQMPALLILLSTLGGLSMFGPLGIVIGPIVAALFVTVWDIFGTVFRRQLAEER